MQALLIALAAQAAVAASAPVDPGSAAGSANPVNPNANALFERDAELKDWALRLYDENRDGWLTTFEAQPAFGAFKEIADGDRDGRVTTAEYARAKAFIAARW